MYLCIVGRVPALVDSGYSTHSPTLQIRPTTVTATGSSCVSEHARHNEGTFVRCGWFRPKSEFYIRVAYFSLNLEMTISRFDINTVSIFPMDYK